MKTLSPDTHPAAEHVQIEILRAMPIAQRVNLAVSLSRFAVETAQRAIQCAHPGASAAELTTLFTAIHYDQELARRLCAATNDWSGNSHDRETAMGDFLSVVLPVIEAFEQLGVAYYIGGSVASIAYGFARSTIDVDVIADMQSSHTQPFVERLRAAYYVDGDMIQEAIINRASFNVIHLASGMKVDVFIPRSRPLDREMLRRARPGILSQTDPRSFYLASPEDTILAKLEWYALGNRVSDRQWSDVLGVLKVQATALDLTYLRHWAAQLGIADLLEQALVDAGL